jgi:hypothetical protein
MTFFFHSAPQNKLIVFPRLQSVFCTSISIVSSMVIFFYCSAQKHGTNVDFERNFYFAIFHFSHTPFIFNGQISH